MTSVSHPSDGNGQLEQILANYLRAEEAGRPLDQEMLLREYPGLADELRSFFANRAAMQQLAVPLRGAAAETPTLGMVEAPADGHGRIRYFGDYELLEELGRGGMGVVYKARQKTLNRMVALKMILAGRLASAVDVQRFKQEAEAAANLDHPHIAPIHEIGEHQGQHYFSMKLIEGRSLHEALPDFQRDIPLTVHLLVEVARAVHHAHQRGVLHRDLKPGNVLLDQEGIPYVTDFGLAKRVEGGSDMTRTGDIVGTPSYMAPEQANGEKQLSTAVDVYSIGAILYELLTGRPPFKAETPGKTLLQVMSADPVAPRTLNPKVDRDLETVALKCLEKEPNCRYESAAALADDLERWLRREPVVARPISSTRRFVRWVCRKPAMAAAWGLLCLAFLLGAAGGLTLWRWQASEAARTKEQRLRLETEHARDEARSARDGERVAREGAEREYQRAERLVYAGHVTLAQHAIDHADMLVASFNLAACKPELRGWEHAFLEKQFQRKLRSLDGHESDVCCVACSADGTRIASCDSRGAIKLWDAQTGAELSTFEGHKQNVSSVAFSSDRSMLASGSFDNSAVIWNSETGDILHALSCEAPVDCVSFSPDGAQLVSASRDNLLRIWDVATGNLQRTIQGHESYVFRAAFSPDGRQIASVSADRTVKLWDAASGAEVRSFAGHQSPVYFDCLTCIDFS